MKCVLSCVCKGNIKHMVKSNSYVNMEHLAGLLNSEYQVKVSIQTIIKHVLPAKVRAMKLQQQ